MENPDFTATTQDVPSGRWTQQCLAALSLSSAEVLQASDYRVGTQMSVSEGKEYLLKKIQPAWSPGPHNLHVLMQKLRIHLRKFSAPKADGVVGSGDQGHDLSTMVTIWLVPEAWLCPSRRDCYCYPGPSSPWDPEAVRMSCPQACRLS